jgi:xanthine dehydrogenase small subunit
MKKPIKFIINNREVETRVSSGTVTLDFIREHLKLPGTKEGCREGECGACTILIGELKGDDLRYEAVASCLLPLGELDGKHLVTVEGLNGETLTPVQQSLTDEGASQCGFCTPGIVLSLTGFFLVSESLDYQDALDALDGNICRCTGYKSIQRAARKLSDTFAPQIDKDKSRIQQLAKWSVLPEYFLDIPVRLKLLTADAPAEARPKSDGVIVAGATDLYVQRPEELVDEKLEFISRAKLAGIKRDNGSIYIGAGTSVEEMKQSPLLNEIFPNMREYLNLVSSTIMRNRATVGGNIVNASPIGDITIMLLGLDARIHLLKGAKKRDMRLKTFFKGYKKMDLKKGELVEAVTFPEPGKGWRFHFEKVSQRKYLDIASANSAVSVKVKDNVIEGIHLSAGGVAPVPFYLEKTCAYLTGKTITDEVLREAVDVMKTEISPISDVRGSAEYKTLLLGNLILAHFAILFKDKIFATDKHG